MEYFPREFLPIIISDHPESENRVHQYSFIVSASIFCGSDLAVNQSSIPGFLLEDSAGKRIGSDRFQFLHFLGAKNFSRITCIPQSVAAQRA